MNLESIHAFVINVDKELYRYKFFLEHTSQKFPTKINHKSAISLETIREKYASTKKTYTLKRLKELSHENTICSIIEEARRNNWDYILIFEDDAECRFDKSYIEDVIKEIPEDVDMCYLGCYMRRFGGRLIQRSRHILQICSNSGNIWGFHAVILGKKVYNALCEKLNNSNNKIIADMALSQIVNSNKYKCYLCNPCIVYQSAEMNSKNVKSLHDNSFNFEKLEKEHSSLVRKNIKKN